MKATGSELEFISQIKRDGSGTVKVSNDYINDYLKKETFQINCLSLSEETFIASGFNSFIVKLKK